MLSIDLTKYYLHHNKKTGKPKSLKYSIPVSSDQDRVINEDIKEYLESRFYKDLKIIEGIFLHHYKETVFKKPFLENTLISKPSVCMEVLWPSMIIK